ncbi:MAG TPA: CHAT domain-containing protein, partial [Vicinamibacterales bacterium]
FGDLLTVLVNPTLGDILDECRKGACTHVHVLAHGDADPSSPGTFGLVFRDESGGADIVSGERLAGALTSLVGGRMQRPAVATIASCDSANVGTVIVPGASVAHALHQSGIPLVVASQFPLSKEGSVPLASTLYPALLRGEHPLLAIQRLRSELHARHTSTWHDWASLVVYEALPLSMDDSLVALRYAQARRGIEAALGRIDRAARAGRPDAARVAELVADVDAATARLPDEGPFAAESMGLRASAHKRLAQLVFTIDRVAPGISVPAADRGAGAASTRGTVRLPDPYDLLERSLQEYEITSRKFLTNDAEAVQRIATLHWVLVQVISLYAVLGKPVDAGLFEAARVAADTYLAHADPEAQAWAHGSLAELALLRLAAPDLDPVARRAAYGRALDHLRALLRLAPGRDAFIVTSTLRQLARYLEWWGSAAFVEGLAARTGTTRTAWGGEHGLLACAAEGLRLLERRRRSVPPTAPDGSASPRGTSFSPAGSAGGAGRMSRAHEDGPVAIDDGGADAARTLAKPARPVLRPAFLSVHLLPAGHGDCLWIEYGRGRYVHRWLMDCGTQGTAPLLLERAGSLASRERLELFVLSHIDADHIGGALPFFQAVQRGLRFGDVWFNGWRHLGGQLGARQGEMFSTAIQDFRLPWNRWRDGEAVAVDGSADVLPEHVLPGGMRLTLLSPTPRELRRLAPVWARELKRAGLVPGSRVDYGRFLEGTHSASDDIEALAAAPFVADTGVPNGTSIALLAEYEGTAVLLAADAHAPVLVASIRRLLAGRGLSHLKVDAFKVSHHASSRNVSVELLQLLECRRYLISTNGDYFAHPDRESIARIILHGGPSPHLVFNYRSDANRVWANPAWQERHGYTATYPAPGGTGIVVPLI